MSKKEPVLKKLISKILKSSPVSPRNLYLFTRKYPPLLYLVNKIIIMMIPEKLETLGGVVFLNKNDAVISGALLFGVYENTEIESWIEKIESDSVVIDIGGNIGVYTILAGKKAVHGKVICFEPEDENLKLLKKSVQENKLSNVTIIEKCVGDAPGESLLNISKYNKGKHSLIKSEDDNGTQKVEIVTIDDEVDRLGLQKVDIAKIDVEGWEAKVLEGMKNTIDRFHPEILFEFSPQRIKQSGTDPIEFLKKIENKGYKFYKAETEFNEEYSMDEAEKLSKEKFFDTFINLWAIPKNSN